MSTVSMNYVASMNNVNDGIRMLGGGTHTPFAVTATNNGRYGIYADGGDRWFTSGYISGNTDRGLRFEGGAWVYADGISIITNGTVGVTGRETSLGEIFFSSIHSNTFLDAEAVSSAYLFVPHNWWGQDPPDPGQFASDGGATIEYTPWLSSDPTGAPSYVAYDRNTGEGLPSAHSSQVKSDNDHPARFIAALRQGLDEDRPDDPIAFLNARRDAAPAESLPWIDLVKMEVYTTSNAVADAERIGQALLAAGNEVTDAVRRTAARRLFMLYLTELGRPDDASKMLALLHELEDPEAVDGVLDGVFRVFAPEERDPESPPAVAEAGDVPALGSYPNPFNPVTRISFTLMQDSHVRLAVYDMLGRRVALLVDDFHAAGTHNITFDGSALPSGVYLYRLYDAETTVSRTMTLVK